MKCILITGMGHSGTRLVARMLGCHPDILLPKGLNRVCEYDPLHKFFIESMDKTEFYSDEYSIDKNKLGNILFNYVYDAGKSNEKYFILKLPYYPLNCLDVFTEYIDTTLINVVRPKDKVIASFVSRGEDKSLFTDKERMRQVKKLPEKKRTRYYYCNYTSTEILGEIYDHTQNLVNRSKHPFINLNIEDFATHKHYIRKILNNLKLEGYENKMLSLVKRDRLFNGSPLIKFLRYFKRRFK